MYYRLSRSLLAARAETNNSPTALDSLKWRSVPAQIVEDDENPPVIRVALASDGKVLHVNFWDLDKTLLYAEPMHCAAVERIYPNAATTVTDRKNLHKTYLAGFTLGNSFREWDRMRRIYEGGETHYKDAERYARDFIGNDAMRCKIDEPGHPEGWHERANEILQEYGKSALSMMAIDFQKNPDDFRKKIVKPEMIAWLQQKSKQGEAHVFMTANQQHFARGLVRFSGLAEYGLLLASDETMVGGGKEIAIASLISELRKWGLEVHPARATAIGDSIMGDVGSGAKAGLGQGIWVVERRQDITAKKVHIATIQKQYPDFHLGVVICQEGARFQPIRSQWVRPVWHCRNPVPS